MSGKEKELNKKLFLIEDWLKIVEDFFLYHNHKSNLIKRTLITELNKYILLFDPIPYFAEKEDKDSINITCPKIKVSVFVKKKIIRKKFRYNLLHLMVN